MQGAAQVARQVVAADGVRGLYRGFGTVILGIVPARVVGARPRPEQWLKSDMYPAARADEGCG